MNQTLKKIREAKDTRTETVTVEDWGVDLILVEPVRKVIRALQENHLKLDPISGDPMEGSDTNKFGMALMTEMVHDVDGSKVFCDDEGTPSIEVAEAVLDEKSQRILNMLIEKCGELIAPPQEEGIEEAEKNSEGTPA